MILHYIIIALDLESDKLSLLRLVFYIIFLNQFKFNTSISMT